MTKRSCFWKDKFRENQPGSLLVLFLHYLFLLANQRKRLLIYISMGYLSQFTHQVKMAELLLVKENTDVMFPF